MRLRARLAVAVTALLVPLLAAFVLLVATLREHALEESLGDFAVAALVASGGACAADPTAWGGPVEGHAEAAPIVDVWAYGADLRPLRPSAPPLDPALVAGAEAGHERVALRRGAELAVLVRGDATGPCAFVLARRAVRRGGFGPRAGAPWIVIPLLCTLLVVAVIVLLLGPIVRRIHRLQGEVRAAADAGYRGSVTVDGDDEITALSAAFADSSREIVRHLDAQARRERTLRDFLANTTHDVMVPLTVLQGHLAALLGIAGADARVRAAMQEADYIAALIHNLEIAARLDAAEPELARDRLDLRALVERVVGRHRPVARRRGVELGHAVPSIATAIAGDLTLIERALSNLVNNAICHHPGGGHVAVILEVEGDEFRLLVKDDGPGIPPDTLARIMAPGERGDGARTRHPGGRGLGLAIARRVVDAHGWHLAFRSLAEGGLEVEVRGALEVASPATVRR